MKDYLCGYEKYRSIKSFETLGQQSAPKERKEKKEKPRGGDRSLEKQLRAVEREIEKQEQLLSELDGKIEAASADYQTLAQLMEEKAEEDARYNEMMERWEQLSLELEEAQ